MSTSRILILFSAFALALLVFASYSFPTASFAEVGNPIPTKSPAPSTKKRGASNTSRADEAPLSPKKRSFNRVKSIRTDQSTGSNKDPDQRLKLNYCSTPEGARDTSGRCGCFLVPKLLDFKD